MELSVSISQNCLCLCLFVSSILKPFLRYIHTCECYMFLVINPFIILKCPSLCLVILCLEDCFIWMLTVTLATVCMLYHFPFKKIKTWVFIFEIHLLWVLLFKSLWQYLPFYYILIYFVFSHTSLHYFSFSGCSRQSCIFVVFISLILYHFTLNVEILYQYRYITSPLIPYVMVFTCYIYIHTINNNLQFQPFGNLRLVFFDCFLLRRDHVFLFPCLSSNFGLCCAHCIQNSPFCYIPLKSINFLFVSAAR